MILHQCQGNCEQGRKACPHIDECCGERPPRKPSDRVALIAIALTAILPALCIGCVAIFGRHS